MVLKLNGKLTLNPIFMNLGVVNGFGFAIVE
jgi:hypothetical protein